MCIKHELKSNYSNFFIYFIVIFAAIISGLSDISFLHMVGLFISEVFIKIFKCISLPIIALSIIVTLTKHKIYGPVKKIWIKTLFYTISTTLIAATITCFLYAIIAPVNINREIVNPQHISNEDNYLKHLFDLIPRTIFSPFLEHQVMGVLFISVTLGVAITSIKDEESRATISQFFQGLHSTFLVIVSWIVSIIPIGIYGFITTTTMQLKSGVNALAIGEYLSVIVLANLVQGFIILPLWLIKNKIKPYSTMLNMLPALSLGFFSKSSVGTLPVTIAVAEEKLGINPKISRLVLPLCTTVNMNGCAAFIFATVIYVMQNNLMEVTFGTMIVWIFISTITAIGNAGIPMGCFLLSASLLSSMNVPITLLGVILPFYAIIDMIETALNIWSDSCVAKVIDKNTAIT